MRYLPLLIVAFLFIGCSPSALKVSEYIVNVKTDATPSQEKGCSKYSLKIGQAFSSNALMTLEMNYGLGDYKQLRFSQSLWARSPNKAISSEITKYIKDLNLFKNVQISKSRSRNERLLEINIEDFMQYFSADEKSSYTNSSISLTLINLKTNRVISTKTFYHKENVVANNASGGVIALNTSLESILKESGIWLNGVCK